MSDESKISPDDFAGLFNPNALCRNVPSGAITKVMYSLFDELKESYGIEIKHLLKIQDGDMPNHYRAVHALICLAMDRIYLEPQFEGLRQKTWLDPDITDLMLKVLTMNKLGYKTKPACRWLQSLRYPQLERPDSLYSMYRRFCRTKPRLLEKAEWFSESMLSGSADLWIPPEMEPGGGMYSIEDDDQQRYMASELLFLPELWSDPPTK